MWRIVYASATGTSHIATNLPCQDVYCVETIQSKDSQDYLVCLVSDGAGSAQFGGEGAQLTCSVALSSIKRTLSETRLDSLIEVERWVKEIQHVIRETADTNGLGMREYACTFLGAIIGYDDSLFFQIGDGAIVASSGYVQGLVFCPDTGMYANMTYFITEEDALSHLQVTGTHAKIDEIALFSDGIQNLALSLEQYTPHIPFFEPMLHKIRTSSTEDCLMFNQLLEQFLNSASVNERTNDDKTLILASRRFYDSIG